MSIYESTPWPKRAQIRKNKQVKLLHDAGFNTFLEVYEDTDKYPDGAQFASKRQICIRSGNPDLLVCRPGYGPWNWDFLKDKVEEHYNGPRPLIDGGGHELDVFNRDHFHLLPVTQQVIDWILEERDLDEIDPDKLRRASHPIASGGQPTAGWISNRCPRFTQIINAHYRSSIDNVQARRRELINRIVSTYKGKALGTDEFRASLEQAFEPPTPESLPELLEETTRKGLK
jgi:hypothetical protein